MFLSIWLFFYFQKASVVPLFKYIWSFFGQVFNKEVKNWRLPLAIKTKKYFAFNTFFFERLRPDQKKSKKLEHSRAKICNTFQQMHPSIPPLRRHIIDWQSEVGMASASLQPIGDTPVKALANRSLSLQFRLSWSCCCHGVARGGRLHTSCSFTLDLLNSKNVFLPYKCNF